MTKLKKVLLSALAICAVGCTGAGVAACSNAGEFPDFRRPTSYVEPSVDPDDEFNGTYYVRVITVGGILLNGVRVDVKLNGVNYMSGITINGEISFPSDTPQEYELVVDESTLPDGYYVRDEDVFKTSLTNALSGVVLYSRVIPTAAESSHRYNPGDVMRDFGYTDNDGNRQTLSELLNEDGGYKAVVLNFWYIDCQPCRAEFPAIQQAYSSYSDRVRVIALNTTDGASAINTFRNENGYTYDMVQDVNGLARMFGVTSTPTTVIIDRYGVFAFIDTGSLPDVRRWNALFSQFTSDDYIQPPPGTQDPVNPPDDPDNPVERPVPDVPEDDYERIATALNGEGANGKVLGYFGTNDENDIPYNWPWKLAQDENGRQFVRSSNVGKDNTFAIITATVNLDRGDYISYDYFTSSEDTSTGSGDVLYVLVDRQLVAQHSGLSKDDPASDDGWLSNTAAYIARRNRTVELAFCYMKDEADPVDNVVREDYVAISNIAIRNIMNTDDPIDFSTDAVSGIFNAEGTQFTEYVTPYYNNDDKYYHVRYTNTQGQERDSILFMDMLRPTPFSQLHVGGDTFTPHNYERTQTSSLYFLIYWDYTNWRTSSDDGALRLTFGGDDRDRLSGIYTSQYYANSFSPTNLIPVTQDLRDLAEAFTREYCRVEDVTYYDNMWLEFCCYMQHYGPEHEDGDTCQAETDPIPGMNFINAYEANLGENLINVWNVHTIDGGGMLSRFVPQTSGVYRFSSSNSQAGDDPTAIVYNSAEEDIAYFSGLVRPDLFLLPNRNNFEGYVYLNAGETYYVRARKGLQTTGTVTLNIEYVGETYSQLRVATTGDGMWTYDPDLGINFAYYIAIDVMLSDDDNCYHALTRDGDYGSVVYIDFVHPNFYETNDHSLYWIIDNGYFDFSDNFGPDYTNVMMQYYQASIAGKNPDDELYGMVEASSELVELICMFLDRVSGDSIQTGLWLSMACYYEYYHA